MAPSDSKFRVAICGGGIGGLVLAIAIGKYSDTPIDIYEAQPSITTTGAGFSLWKRSMEVMKELGLWDDIAKVSTKPPDKPHGPVYRVSDNPNGGYEWFKYTMSYGPSSMHRWDMMDLLQRHLPSTCTVHLSKRLRTFNETTPGDITLYFEDGSTASTNVLFGADGIRSPTRRAMYEAAARQRHPLVDAANVGEYADAKWSGFRIYRYLVPSETLLEKYPGHPAARDFQMLCGQGKHVVSYPVNNGANINVASFVYDPDSIDKPFEGRWVDIAPKQELLDNFKNFEPEVRQVLELCENPNRWALHVVKDLPTVALGNVAIIGDAAHGMAPHTGAGAGQAIEDAYILGRLLAHEKVTFERVPIALKVYDEVRRKPAQKIGEYSSDNGFLYEFIHSSQLGRPRTTDAMREWKEIIIEHWERSIQSGALKTWYEAEMKLQELLSLDTEMRENVLLHL